jgi:hypothetical protein
MMVREHLCSISSNGVDKKVIKRGIDPLDNRGAFVLQSVSYVFSDGVNVRFGVRKSRKWQK